MRTVAACPVAGSAVLNRTLAEIGAMGHSWPGVAGVGIEKVAYQAAAVQEAIRRTMLPILPVVPDKDKVTRARLLEARANASKVYRPYKSDWWTDFSTEASYFPDPGSHDDQIDALSSAVKMAGWSADSIGWAYNIWTCLNPDCKHMFVFEPGRVCPQCGTKAPDTFINPETLSYGGLLEDLTPPVTLPALNPGEVPLEIHDVEVIPHGTSEAQIAALRQTVEQMGAFLIEREGRYFVSTLNPGFMRFALVEQGYVEKVLP
jgi:hypothetical protein